MYRMRLKIPFARSASALLFLASGCSLDWSARSHGRNADAGLIDDDAGRLQDSGPDDSRDDDAGGQVPLAACSEGCGPSASCNEASQTCQCLPDHINVGGQCQPDPCKGPQAPACGEHANCTVSDGLPDCTCDATFTECEGVCRDLQSDPDHCGACDKACAGALSCSAGACSQAVAELVAGADRTCALLHQGSAAGVYGLKCWGSNANAFFREELYNAPRPRPIAGAAEARAMALTRSRHCIVLPTSDTVRCWGSCGTECGLSGGMTSAGDTFNDVTLSGVTGISTAMGTLATTGNTCGMTGNGQVYCWGAGNMIAQLSGNASSNPRRIEVEGTYILTFGSISGATYHSCAVTTDERVACWGLSGSLLGNVAGASSTPNDAVYVEKSDGSDLTDATSVVVGLTNACAVTKLGELWCWGAGSLGVGDLDPRQTATKLSLENVRQAACGNWHGCALVDNGSVYCWGDVGLLGLGANVVGDSEDGGSMLLPQLVPNLTGVVELKAGAEHTCVRLDTGAVKCWGKNDYGQLGDGTESQRYVPTEVVDLY